MPKINDLQSSRIILKKPRVTEKATMAASRPQPVYIFEVAKEADKIQIKKAIIERFKVKPVKIRIINLPAKSVRVKGIVGRRPGVKKALVYLKAGQTIDVV